MALATNTTPGEVQLAGDIDGSSLATAPELITTGVTAGSYTVLNATVDSKGRITTASNATSGQITALLQDATNSSKGIVQVDDAGLLNISSGVLSISAINDATDSVKGILQVDDSGYLSISSGVLSISVPDATGASKGIIQVDETSALSVSSGVLSIDDATNSSKGVIQVDDTGLLNITAGVLSIDTIPDATNSSKGQIQVDDSGALDITAGVLSIDLGSTYAVYDEVGTFTKHQYVQPKTLTWAATLNWDGNDSNTYTVTLGGNTDLQDPTNLNPGSYTFMIKQDGTGGRTFSFPSTFKFRRYEDTDIATGASEMTIVTAVSDGTNLYCTLSKTWS